MSRRVFNKIHLDFLRVEYKKMKAEDLTIAFNEKFKMNQTLSSIRSVLRKNGIKCGRTGSDRLINHVRLFTKAQENFVRIEYKKYKIKSLTKIFNEQFNTVMTEKQIKSMVSRRKIHAGRNGCFKKGNKPWNADTKGQGLTGPNKGSFKKGTVPPNRKPMGFERISKDGFIEIKVDERNPYTGFSTRFKHKHRHVYEQNYGPIPDGMVVALKDSDPQNCDPDNLMLVSRTELLFMNGMQYSKAPELIKPSLAVVAKLKATVAERIKEKA